jgi:hypothetical protein
MDLKSQTYLDNLLGWQKCQVLPFKCIFYEDNGSAGSGLMLNQNKPDVDAGARWAS